MSTINIAVDVMGGDEGADVTLPAIKIFLKKHPQAHITAIALPDVIVSGQKKLQALQNQITWVECQQVVSMACDPIKALRRLKHSSMAIAMKMLREQQVDAVVSGGNTGALMLSGYHYLKLLPEHERPFIAGYLPADQDGHETLMLDLGGHLESNEEHLINCARIGQMLARIHGRENPTVALLNVGSEAIKGTAVVKAVDERLRADESIQYSGFIEGHELLFAHADIVIADGFSGNIALKSMEGAGHYVHQMIKRCLKRNIFSLLFAPLVAWLLRPAIKQMKADEHNGAFLLGLNGIVVKSHGRANSQAYAFAIERAHEAIEHQLLPQLMELQ